MGLLSRVPSHVNHQHVLRLEWFLVPGAFLPSAHERLLIRVDVVVVDVLHELVLGVELQRAIPPVAVGFNEISGFILRIGGIYLGTAQPAATVHHRVHRTKIEP